MTNSQKQDTPIHPVIGKLFALITCKLEDLHEPSVDMHNPDDIAEALTTAAEVQSAVSEISTICDAIQLLLADETD